MLKYAQNTLIIIATCAVCTALGFLIVYYVVVPMLPPPPMNTLFELHLVVAYFAGGLLGILGGILTAVRIVRRS